MSLQKSLLQILVDNVERVSKSEHCKEIEKLEPCKRFSSKIEPCSKFEVKSFLYEYWNFSVKIIWRTSSLSIQRLSESLRRLNGA